MAEVNLKQTLERIRSSKQKERTEGLADLRHILIYNRYSQEVKKVKDESYHIIIESLFKIVENERHAFLKTADNVSKKTQLASRLSQCAAALRSTVEVGVRSLRLKTVKALIYHVTETLPITGYEYCQPLCSDYFKTLHCLFAYQPHVEHLSRQEWDCAVDFCLKCLQFFVSQPVSRAKGRYEHVFTINTEEASHDLSNTEPPALTERGTITDSSRSNASEMVSCLHHLYHASNFFGLDHINKIGSLLPYCLRAGALSASINLEAFKLINTLLPRIYIETKQITMDYIKILIPILRTQWMTKSIALKEEMLITLIYMIPPAANLIMDENMSSTRREFESVLEMLFNDYTRRAHKDQLQLDDITLKIEDYSTTDRPILRTSAFHLRQDIVRAESQWAYLSLLSKYLSLLDTFLLNINHIEHPRTTNDTAKRPRHSFHIIDNLQYLKQSHSTTKVAALQILCFMVQERNYEKETLVDIVQKLLDCISGDYSTTSSWAMVALTGCAIQCSINKIDITLLWTAVWRFTAQAISSSSCCRAACHLMDTLIRLGIAGDIIADSFSKQFFSSLDINTIATVSETSISLVIRILNRNTVDSPSTFIHNAESVLRWLFKKWRSNISEDRLHLSQVAQHCQVYDIIRVLSTCIGKENFISPKSHFSMQGNLGRAYSTLWEQKSLLEYMWQLGGMLSGLELDQTLSENKILGQTSISLLLLLVKMLVSEIDISNEKLNQVAEDKLQAVSIDYIKVVVNQYISGSYVLSFLDGTNVELERKLFSAIEKLLHTLNNNLSQSDTGQEKLDEIYTVLAGCLPSLATYCSRIWSCSAHDSMFSLSKVLLSIIESKHASKRGGDTALDSDMMSASDGLGILNDFNQDRNDEIETTRSGSMTFTDLYKLRSSIETYLRFIMLMPDNTNYCENRDLVLEGFFCKVISLPLEVLLASRKIIAEAIALGFTITQDTVDDYLSSLGTQILGSYKFERSEMGLLLCIEGLHGLYGVWSDPTHSAVYETASDVYHWFVDTALKSGILSNKVKILLSNLLFDLTEASPNFGHELSLPSARSILLDVFKESEILTKWHVAQRIPDLFKLFTLEKHEAIFRDVSDNLPTDMDWEEGISVRLLVFGRLGSAWSTLLRLCVYHIFETAASVKSSIKYAIFCIAEITRSLHLPYPKDLFRLFAPQLLYTWLESQSITTIPFSIFGFQDLRPLLKEAEEEVVGQLVMRTKDDEITRVATILGTSPVQLLEKSIVNSVAYTVAWDTCTVGTKLTNNGSETYLRSKLEKENYRKLIHLHLPRILGVLFKSMEQEHNIEKAFQKKPIYAVAAKTMDEIKENGFSIAQLPAGQQPSFNARFLPDQVERLARRASVDCIDLWTEPLYVYILRMLLRKLDSSLDALHACAVIRKIRILICFAGKVALHGYALKITLHSLRPFASNVQCADDTYGIIVFLLEHGKGDLELELSFMAGFLIPIILSLKEFAYQENGPITQESQFKATLLKAQNFGEWLLKYFDNFCQEIVVTSNEENTRNFQKHRYLVTTLTSFLSSCRYVGPWGNAVTNTPESDMLMKLLEDAKTTTPLLGEESRVLILNLLTKNFKQPQSQKDDIFGRRPCMPEHIPILLRLSQQDLLCNRSFSIWVAKTIGRLYSSQDIVLENWRVDTSAFSGISQEHAASKAKSSRAEVISYLYSCLFANSLGESGLAEQALRTMATHPKNGRDTSILSHILDPSTLFCLNLNNLGLINDPGEKMEIPLEENLNIDEDQKLDSWIKSATVTLTRHARNDAVLGSLVIILARVTTAAKRLFPYILHLVLEKELHSDRTIYKVLSGCYKRCFCDFSNWKLPFARLLINTLFYLRSQRISGETTIMDRERWLLIDYVNASKAAVRCKMYRAALLLLELHIDQEKRCTKRQLGRLAQSVPNELLLQIYKSIDEPDSFYGVHASPGLSSVLDRLDYEENGLRSLPFRGAKLNSQMRRLGRTDVNDIQSVLQSLATLNLNSLTYELLSHDTFICPNSSRSTALETARKLEQWQLKVPDINIADTSAIFKAFQGLSSIENVPAAQIHIDNIIGNIIDSSEIAITTGRESRSLIKNLSVLSEIYDLTCSQSDEELKRTWISLSSDYKTMETRRLDDIRILISSRETALSLLSSNEALRKAIGTNVKDCRLMEVEALLASAKVYREHGALHDSLASITYLTDLLTDCTKHELEIDEALKYEMAATLWESNETGASIGILNHLSSKQNLVKQTIPVGRSKILTTLGHHVAEARLETPEEVTNKYLLHAIKDLKGTTVGKEAGDVYHEFAVFCDRQLHNVDNLDDFNRIQMLKSQKEAEVRALAEMLRNPRSNEEKRSVRSMYDRARQWHAIDEREYERLRAGRDAFLQQSLENYLLSLQAVEKHSSDVLRMFSLWLDYYESPLANRAVAQHINHVPSLKFASLMNQLSSRLQARKSEFQQILCELVLRICIDHPYHSMYHIYSGIRTTGGKDEVARSRNAAAIQISKLLTKEKSTGQCWVAIHNTSNYYYDLAKLRQKENGGLKSGREYLLEDYPASKKVLQKVPALNVPPATMHIKIRPNCDYTDIPKITGWEMKMTIASGISAPKVLTAVTSDGERYKQLFKGGNDDLRQDAIMEQVFEQVSSLLKNHRVTQERKLQIRTYKVLPLSADAGIIEFVRSTIPLFSFLMPAHEKYYPRDWKQSTCREKIGQAMGMSVDSRVKVFRDVLNHFHPIGRYFFLERFTNPDDWFGKRLAYTRSTAAISILGYILGLGDRHCHNILLDERRGDVVHIDLGVAFEAGRVLPVPELVPFRLTRDIVDAMGITGIEGVFRRCCEFVMDTLRDERENIMTLLNVLRYDPLYSWTVSPLKAKRMREAQNGQEDAQINDLKTVQPDLQAEQNESDEAKRALAVVERKLSKSLSTAATVNELIQQATDERNLALLFHGWAAYA